MDNFVSDWNFSWEWLLKCNFRVELFQGWGGGKYCFRLELFLGGVAKTILEWSFSRDGWENVVLDWNVSREGSRALPGRGGKTLF